MSLVLSGTDGLSDIDGSAATPAIRGTDANTGIFFPAADTIAFATGGTEDARFNSVGNLQTIGTISVGNATPSTSGAGITFPATQSASSDANTLDDYEEGTWTPTITGGYTSISYQLQRGWYAKVGSLVIVSGQVQFSGTANSTAISMSCPFTQGPLGYAGGGIPYSDVAVITNTSPYLNTGTATVLFYTMGTGAAINSSANITTKYISFVISMTV